MTLNELAARGAQLTPKKIHAVLPLMLLAMLYWVSSIPGTMNRRIEFDTAALPSFSTTLS